MNSSYIAPYSCIYVNSQYATGTTSNFSVEVTGSQLVPRSDRTVRVAVTEATIPFTYYGIQSSNNTIAMIDVQPIFSTGSTNDVVQVTEYSASVTSSTNLLLFTEDNPGGAVATGITVASGTYTLTTLASTLQADLNAHSPYGYTYTVAVVGSDLQFSSNQTDITHGTIINFDGSTMDAYLGLPSTGNSSAIYSGFSFSTVPTFTVHQYNTTLTSGYYTPAQWSPQLASDLTAGSLASGLGFTYQVSFNTTTYAISYKFSGAPSSAAVTFNMSAPTTAQLPMGLSEGTLSIGTSFTPAPNPVGIYAPYVAQVPAGNYTPSAFLTALIAALNLVSTADGFDVDFSPSAISTVSGTITFAVNNGTNGAGTIIDFNNSTIDNVIGTPQTGQSPIIRNGFSYTTPFVYNLAGPRELHIRCNQLLNSVYETRVQTDGTILAVIPIRFEQESLIIYEPALPKIYAVLGSRMDRMQFRLTDESGNDVSLNGAPMMFTLGIFQ